MVVKICEPLRAATQAIGRACWFQNLCLSQDLNQTVKAKGAMREPAIGSGRGALSVQSPDVADDGNVADIGDSDVLVLKPHPEVGGCPQMQANGGGRIVCFIKGCGDRWEVRTQKAFPHPNERLGLREQLLYHEFLSFFRLCRTGKGSQDNVERFDGVCTRGRIPRNASGVLLNITLKSRLGT
jgi:hypothetical protein